MDILKKIDSLRIEKGWSFYELAEQSSVNQSTLANMYRRKSLPSIQTLQELCNAFGITMSQFFAEEANDIKNEKNRLLLNKIDNLNIKQIQLLLDFIHILEINNIK